MRWKQEIQSNLVKLVQPYVYIKYKNAFSLLMLVFTYFDLSTL